MNPKQYEIFLENAIHNLIEARENNHLSVFAGSGVSIASNLPSWPNLINEFKKKLGLSESESDYLKIAELFYLQFKDDLYFQKIKSYFPSNSRSNVQHEKITKLNANNIITTNWDDLFEKSIAEHGLFYDIVTKDADLGLYAGNKKLIKAHGCINEGQIVFKESDYLSYRDNYPLIDSYLKGIFSTDTVLIIGYSLNDFNIKKIINWVGSKSKHNKFAYLLKVDAKFDYLEFEYYKKKNIFVLYWNQAVCISEEEKVGLDKKSCYTVDFLNRITGLFKSKIELSIEKVILTSLEVIDKFSNYPALISHTILTEFENRLGLKYGELYYYNNNIIISNIELQNIFKNKENITRKNISIARQIMRLTGAKSIQVGNIKLKGPKIDYLLEDYLLGFDFENLSIKIDKNSPVNIENENRLLEAAYYKYQARDFEGSYEVLIKTSRVALRNRNYFIWYLSEFNKTHLKYGLINTKDYSSNNKLKNYFDSSRVIDLSEHLLKLPLRYRNKLKPFLDFEKLLDKRLIQLLIAKDDQIQSLNVVNKGGISINNLANDAIQIFSELQFFITRCFLTIQYTPNIKKIFESIFKIILLEQVKNEIYRLPSVLFSIGVLYYEKPDQLENLFRNNFSEISFQQIKEDKENVVYLFKKIVSKRLNEDFFDNFSSDLLDKAAVFLSYTELSKSDISEVIDLYSTLLHNNQLTVNNYRWLNLLLVNRFNMDKNCIPLGKLSQFIKSYISYIMTGRNFFYTVQGALKNKLINNIFSILKFANDDFVFDDLDQVKGFIYHLNSEPLETILEICEVVLFSMYIYSSEEIKKEFNGFFNGFLTKYKENSISLLEFKFLLIINKIKPELKDEVIKQAKIIEEYESSKKYPDRIDFKGILLSQRILEKLNISSS